MNFRVQIEDPAAVGTWVDTIELEGRAMAVVIWNDSKPTDIVLWPIDILTVTHFKDGNEWRPIDQL